MKKIIIAPFIICVVLLLSGCDKKTEEAKKQESNSTAEMQAKIDEQQAKIDELNSAKNKQNEEIGNLRKGQDVVSCQKKKEDCEKKFFDLDNSELQINRPGVWKGSRTEMIKKLQKLIDGWEDNLDDIAEKSHRETIQDAIENAEKEISKIKSIMTKEASEKNNLLAGECKDYQNPCE